MMSLIKEKTTNRWSFAQRTTYSKSKQNSTTTAFYTKLYFKHFMIQLKEV